MANKKKQKTDGTAEYDLSEWKPFLRCSICTGEQTACFRNRQTNQVEEIGLIRGPEDLRRFMETYGITGEIEKVY